MRNTCALNIVAIPPRVQLRIITNAQRLCDMTENTPLRAPLYLTPGNENHLSGTLHLTPGNQHLNPGTTGSQTTLTLGTKAKASTYASSCFMCPNGPFPGLLTGGE